MNDEKKYSIVGKVEIGTDEYRELIESAVKYERQVDEYRSKFWKEQDEVKAKDSQITELKAEIKKLKDLLATTTAGCTDDAFTAFMKMLGEE